MPGYPKWGRSVATTLLVLVLLLSGSGCIALDRDDRRPAHGQFDSPAWNHSLIGEHVRFLSNALEDGDLEEAARYVSDRLREYRVQPGMGERYRQIPQRGNIFSMGLIGGRNPDVYDEAVLVSVDITDVVATAAWLELARLQAAFSRTGVLPERSLIFVAWKDGQEGLRDFLRSPPWLPQQISAWVYLHPPANEQEVFQEVGAEQGWRYHLVYPQLSSPMETPTPAVRLLAERAHANIRAEAISGGAFLPIRPHVLVAPLDFDEPPT